MSYTALYRKFRPLRFDEMVGQEHITKTIKNQIVNGRVGHAYLFNGGRGTGKTSSAKILARAVNCLNPQDGEPCNECEICKQTIAGSLTDVVEMDAASNNSVEDIRLIRDEVNFLPTLAKYRVYIIDEVHMLSTGAFNALLKTLEEPPEHVKFILATTEPGKLPATILSRCQRFDFRQISEQDIIKRLKIICDESEIKITDRAVSLIAALSEGAMRDGISILERCVQDGIEKIDEPDVRELAGIPDSTYINRIVKAIIEYNIEEAINTSNEVFNQGKDTNNFLWEIIKYIKDVLVYKTTRKLNIYNEEEIGQIKELGDKISKERLLSLIYTLSELENTLKWSTQRQLMFQTGIIKACSNITSGDQNIEQFTELEKRIFDLEQKLLNMKTISSDNIKVGSLDTTQKKEMPKEVIETIKEAEEKAQINKIETEYESEMKEEYSQGEFKNWSKVLDTLKKSGKMIIYTNLINTVAKEINDMTIGIEFKGKLTDFGKKVLEQAENRKELERLVSLEYGKEMAIRFLNNEEAKNLKTQSHNIAEVANDLDIAINIIDE